MLVIGGAGAVFLRGMVHGADPLWSGGGIDVDRRPGLPIGAQPGFQVAQRRCSFGEGSVAVPGLATARGADGGGDNGFIGPGDGSFVVSGD